MTKLVRFERSLPLPTTSVLDEYERRFDIRLPKSYQRFLIEKNGGRPAPDALDIPGWSFKGTIISRFFGISGNDNSELHEVTEFWRDDLPQDVIPIGISDGGDYLLLATAGERPGAVYFLTARAESGEDVFRVADSFDELLSKLYEFHAPIADESDEEIAERNFAAGYFHKAPDLRAVSVADVHSQLTKSVPDVANGQVRVVTVCTVPIPGTAVLAAVASEGDGVDPVASCEAGKRSVEDWLASHGYAPIIDFVRWNADPLKFVAFALSPIRVHDIRILPWAGGGNVTAVFVAPADQSRLYGLSAGRRIQLAAMLTGQDLEIKDWQPDKE